MKNKQKRPHQKVSNKMIIQALRATGGFVTGAAVRLNVTPSCISKRLTGSPELQAAQAEVMESKLDMAESAVLQAVARGEAWAVCFMLKCKGKARGYVERQELTGADGGPIRTKAEDLTDDELDQILGEDEA